MKKHELQTPAILLDLDKLEHNIQSWQALCNENGKELWPMIKTHKSTALAKMQLDAGATGFLCGTLDECEMVYQLGAKHIMYAYPTANPVNIRRLLPFAKDAELIIRLDTVRAAEILNSEAEKAGVIVSYTVIVDMDFHRFGMPADAVVDFVKTLSSLKNLKFRGISTHPGQVYGCTTRAALEEVAKLEKDTMKRAADALAAAGFPCEIISSGSTPTFEIAIKDKTLNVSHPGNFDAGSKCLGLDQGAHGNSAIKGFGYVVGHPELTIVGLSEEVAKVKADGTCDLQVGDQVEIIPNHSCSTANNTGWYTCVRGDEIVDFIAVDARENSKKKGTL